ncbi:MAG: DUF4436 family protein [Anaerolineae bacterium]
MKPTPPTTNPKLNTDPANTPPRPANYRWLRRGVLLAAVLLVTVFVLTLFTFNGEGDKRTVWQTSGADPKQQPNLLDIKATIQGIDPGKGEMNVRLEFTPNGALDGGEGWSTQSDIAIYTSSSLKPEIILKAGQRITAQDVALPLYDGDYSLYPFDEHTAELWFVAISPEQETALPLRVELAGQVFGYRVQGKPDADNSVDLAALVLTVERSPLTRIWAVFVMILLWAMSLSVAGVASSMLLGRRKLEFAAFTWMGSMLFAFVGFRSAAPGAPPIGSLIDVLAFFWAELIVAVSLVTVVLTYLTRGQKT